ncbi:MAG TPA: nitroreductase family protein [Chloroflexota bacterium]|jgi:nitroreductase|nr:nitroreductase family protein [Chloroflexota bacterium]
MENEASTRDRLRFLRRLRAVRRFLARPVPPQAVDDILEVARWSGSANNRQPWELVVVRDAATLQALGTLPGAIYARHLAGAPLGIVLVMSGEPGREVHETYDEGRLSERIMLAAAAHGLGSCIGWFPGESAAAAKRLLGIPQERLVRTAISIGYPDAQAQQSRSRADQPRKPLSELVHQERYGG